MLNKRYLYEYIHIGLLALLQMKELTSEQGIKRKKFSQKIEQV